MPKETFFNLQCEKREMIENVAIDEFAAHNYDQASINTIIKNCGIAKGSFYQYFEDKADLYKHLMGMAVTRKLKYMSPLLAEPEKLEFFTLVREMYISGLKFANENPRFVDIGNRLLQDKNKPIYKEIMGENMSSAYDLFNNLLKIAISKGEIRSDIDTRFVSHMISDLNVSIIEYYRNEESEDEANIWTDKMMVTVDKFIDILKHGISTSATDFK